MFTIQRLAEESSIQCVDEYAEGIEVLVVTHKDGMTSRKECLVPVQTPVDANAILGDGPHFFLHHQQGQALHLLRSKARAAPGFHHRSWCCAVQVCAELGTGLVFLKPAGYLQLSFLQRQRTCAHLLVQLAVHFFPAHHAGWLVGNVVACVRRHPYFKLVHGPKETLNRLALPVVGPCVDDRAAEVAVQTEKACLLKVRTALKEPGPESPAVVEVDDARELAQNDAAASKRRRYAGRVLRCHDLPAQWAVARAIVEQHKRHTLGLARVRVNAFEVQGVAVCDHHITHFHQVPVAEKAYGALVIPCLFSFAEGRPTVETLSHVGLREPPDGGVGGHEHPLRLKLALHFPHTLADGRGVRIQNVPQDDMLVPLRQQRTPPMSYTAPVRENQHTPGSLLLHLPAFKRLPGYRTDFLQQLRPHSGTVGFHKCRFLCLGCTVFALPYKVLPQQVRPRQRLVALLVVQYGRGRDR